MRSPLTFVPLVLPRSATSQVLSGPRRTSACRRLAAQRNLVSVEDHSTPVGKGKGCCPLTGRDLPRDEQGPGSERLVGLDGDVDGTKERVPLLLGVLVSHFDKLLDELLLDGLELRPVCAGEQHLEGVRR